MIKYFMIIISGLLLTGGTLLNSEAIQDSAPTICESSPVSSLCKDITDNRDVVGFDKGLPFSFVADFGETGEALKEKDISSLADRTIGFDIQNFMYSYGFWLLVSSAGYFAFTKLRNIAGNATLVVLLACLIALYFGAITL